MNLLFVSKYYFKKIAGISIDKHDTTFLTGVANDNGTRIV